MTLLLNSKQKASESSFLTSIIICTRGRCRDLANTLESLSRVEVPSHLWAELLVVENGVKGSAEVATASFRHNRITARYLFEAVPGKSNALNRAIAESNGRILLFTDDDVRFPSDWVRCMCEAIHTGRADAVAGGVKLAPHLLRPWMNHTHRAWLASTADYLSPESPSEMCGANMALSRKVIDKIGGFDPELGPGVTGGGEESLLTWQLKKAGFKLASALDVQVEHHLDPERLRYKSWINAARLQGETRAYLMHHWFHQRMQHPSLMRLYYFTKLSFRRACEGVRNPDDEGIAPWELSYIQDMAKCARFVQERRRARNYILHGLRKRTPDHKTVAI